MASSSVLLTMDARKVFLYGVIFLMPLGLLGCPKTGYMGGIEAYISQHQVAPIRAAWLKLGGFEGPKEVKGGAPNCSYYTKRLTRSSVSVAVDECYEWIETSQRGWIYRVSVYTWGEARRPDVRAEIEELVEQIRRAIQAQVPDAKVTKGAGAVAMPF